MAKIALITGGSQGSGRATALLFARKGYDVAIAARSPELLHQVADEITALGRQALAVPTDVTDPQQVQALVDKTRDRYGQVDVLVNSAGICLTGPSQHTSLEDWHKLFDTNFWGYLHTIKALLPHFIARRQGTIVNIGSFGGKMPLPQMTAYTASKYAVTGLTDALRLELAEHKIHVAAVHPGVIQSSFMERAMFRGADEQASQAAQERMTSVLNMGWVSQPEDIAKAVWEAVEKRKHEIVVGPIAIATEAHRLFPGLVEWAMERAT
ncbi:SDR family oxidoreductase [Romeria aff. gracilis LEGE 07310]|uniref:SDR family oxidoreductase n=1 Tax=Vasconcelosia minhoensis LEGE 07310 TaxID=915328 RepID=A0A8J7DLY8_9CYAN|nr:SDR family oxidoreductase [Romeria gracilis]MBE9077976.1 SDR family oxidoreductase [Romeria aff. gracilis LEGE 07310]